MGYSPGLLFKIGRFRLFPNYPETSRTIPYVVRNPFASILATFLESLGRFPALAKISHVQNHGLQPRIFGQNWPISAHCKFSRNIHEQSRTQLDIHFQASWRRFQGVLADFQHLPKSAIFKTMGYSPGFLVKIGRFRLIPNYPENFTNNPVRSQKSICKHLGDVFREFGSISSTCQNQPCSKPWAIAQDFWSKSADFGSLQILSKTSRTSLYAVSNPFASILATFLGRFGRLPALAKISHFQSHGLQPWLFGQNRPISAHCKCSRKLHEQVFTHLQIHFQACWRRFQEILADFQHLPKSALFKTMGYSPGFLVKIGRFRLIPNYPENFTNNRLRSLKSICKHLGDVFREFGPIFCTYQNQPFSKPWAIAQAFWSKSADFGSFQILSKTSRTSLYAVRNPFPSILATFLGSLGRFPALAKISHVQNHGLQPRLFGQNRPISAHSKISGKHHEQVFTHLDIHLYACWRRFQRVLADFQHLPKSALSKSMGYSPGFLVKIGRFRLIPNSPENITNKSLRTQKSISKHLGDVFREFGPISSTCQNQPCSKPWAIAQAFWSKSADFGSLQILRKTSRTSLYALRHPFVRMLATFLESFGRFPALTKIRPLQIHGLQPRLFGQNRPIAAHSKFSRKIHEQVFTQLEIHFQACWRRFYRVWADFQHLQKSAMFKTMGYSPGFLGKIGRFRLIPNSPENITNKSLRPQKSICTHVGDVFIEFGPISSTCQNQPCSKPWAIAQDFWSKSADFGSLQILSKTSRTSLYAVSNPFPSILATFLGRFGRFPALAKISHFQSHGLQPWLFGQNRPISAHCKRSRKLHEQVFTHLQIHFQAYWRRFQEILADFQHLPKSALFKTMGYSPGFLVKIGRFRLIPNYPENFTNNPLRSLKSICKHLGDVFREFGPIFCTYQNQPFSKPWAIAQAFWSKSADFGSLHILSKTSRTSLYAVRNPFPSILATFLGSLGRFPALAKISHVQNHGLQPRLFGQNRPIAAHSKFSRKLHEQVFTQLEIHFQASWRRFYRVWADFQHLQKSAMFKTMGYSPGFLVKIGRFRLIPNSPENITNKSLRPQKSICTHVGDVFIEFGPISSTCQNQPCSKPWAIAQDFWSKSADFGSLQILSKTSRTSLYAVSNPFPSILATFLGRFGRFPALAKISHFQSHGLQPWLFGQNRPISAHCKCSRKLHEQVFTHLQIHFQECWRRFQEILADFQHLPKSALFKTMGYSPGFLVKIGRFRLIPNYPENFTNNPLRSLKSICKHLGDVFIEFGPIFCTYQNQPFSKPWAIAQAFWSKSADCGSFQILSKTSRTSLYGVRNPFPSILATFLGSLGRFPALAKIRHVQNHGLQPRLFVQNRPISAHSKFSGKHHEQVFTHLEIHFQASWRRFQGVWADFQHLPKSAMFKTMGYSPGFLVKIGRFRLIPNSPENITNKSLRPQKSICTHVGDVFGEFWPISSTYQNPPSSNPWAIAQAFWSKSADFGSFQILSKTSRTSLYAVRNPFPSILVTFLSSLGRFPALAKISHVQNHGLQPRLFGQNRPISAHSKFSGKHHEQVFTHLEIHFQASWRRFQGVWADFQHLPKSAMFKSMGYSPGFLVKIGRFRLIPNSPENITNKSLRPQTSICTHVGDGFREFWPISSTYQNPPSSNPWAIAQAFWSKSADCGSFQILSKTSRTSLYAVRNPFPSILATFLSSLGRFPAIAKISHVQNHGLQPRLFGQNRPISAHSKFSGKHHEQVFTHLEIHFQASWRRFQGVWADFQHLPKSAMFKTMGYSPGFLVKIGRFRLIPKSPENITNKSLRTQTSICTHVGDVFREFWPISSTYQNPPSPNPWAIAQAFWSKSADCGSFQILQKTSRTSLYAVRNPFPSILATFLSSLGRFPALAKIRHVQNHGLQPRLFGQNRPISAHSKFSGKHHEQVFTHLEIHFQASWRRFQGVWADFQHLPKSAMFKTMGYSPGFLVKIGRFRLIPNSPENITNKSLRPQTSICTHVGDVFREFWPISSTYQNPPSSNPWAIAQAFWSKSADCGSFQILSKNSRTSLYAVRNPFPSMLATFLSSLGRFPALAKISHVQNHGLQPRLFGQNRPISAHSKFSGKHHEQVFTPLEIHLYACWRCFYRVWADFQHLPKSAMFKTMGYSPGFLVKIGRFRLIANSLQNFTNKSLRSQQSISKHLGDVFRAFWPISSTCQNQPFSKPWAIALAFWSKSADFGSLQMFPKTSRTSLYALTNPFPSILATFLGNIGRFPALAKIRPLQNHGLQPRLFGQNRPISAHSKLSRKLHEQSPTQFEIHLQASWRRFQRVWADFLHLPKSAIFKTMGYSPGFLVKIGRFRLIANSLENFTNKSLCSQKSISKHLGDVFREFGPISSTCQNQPCSKPWAIAQAFWSKSADCGSFQILSKTSRTSLYAVRNPFPSILATFLSSLGRFPALAKISHVQNHGLQPRLFGQNRPISAHSKFSGKHHEQVFTPLEIHLYACWRCFYRVWADFQHLPKSAMFKTMGYSPGFLVKIGRFRLIANSLQNFTNKSLRSQQSISKHLGDVFRAFWPISSTCQNQPFSKPWAIALAFWSKSADFGSLQMFPKTSRTSLYALTNPFPRMLATFLGNIGRFPALAKIRPLQNHGLQPRLFGQNRPISAHSKLSKWAIALAFWANNRPWRFWSKPISAQPFASMGFPLQMFTENFTNKSLRTYKSISKNVGERFQEILADFQHLPKSALFKTMGYSPGFLVKIGRFRLIPNYPENFTNNPLRSLKSICKHLGDVFREFGPIFCTYQNQPFSKPWAIAQAFWSKSADCGSFQILSKTSRTSLYGVRNPFPSILATFLSSLGRFPALAKIRHVQNHGLQPRLFVQNRPISAHSKFSGKPHEQVFTHLEIHFQASWRRFQGVWADFQHLPKSAMFKTMGYSPGFLVKIGRFRLIPNSLENFTNKSLRSQKSISKHLGDVFIEFGPISSTCKNQPCSKPWAIAQAFWAKSADFGSFQILRKTSRTSLYALRNPFVRMLAMFLSSLGRFPALAKISHVQNHGLQPRIFGQNRPISAHCKFSPKLHEQVFTQLAIHLQASWRRFQGVLADFQHLPKSAIFKAMGYSPGFLVKIGRFRLIANVPENFTNKSLRTYKSISKNVGDVFRKYWPISSTCQNPPSSKPWAIAQAFWSKSADFGSFQIIPKTSRTIPYVV